MDTKEARRKSRRRSLRFLKSGQSASDNREKIVSEVYGSVWLAEREKPRSPSYSETDNFQSDCLNEYGRLQSHYQVETSHVDFEGDHIHYSVNTDNDKTQMTCHDIEKPQYCCHGEIHKQQSSVWGDSDKQQSSVWGDSDKQQSSVWGDSDKQQSSVWGDSDKAQCLDESDNHQSPGLCDNVQLLGLKLYDESDKVQALCQSESCISQVLQPVCRKEQNGDHLDCESARLHSQCVSVNEQLKALCHSEHVNSKSSDNSETERDQSQSRCYNETELSWSVCRDAHSPEAVRSTPAVPASPDSSISVKETAIGGTVDASYTLQTSCSESEKQPENAVCTTPVCQEFECEMNSETSLDKGFCHLEESPYIFENSADACSGVDRRVLQAADSPAGADTPVKIMAGNTACGEKLNLQSEENIVSFPDTPISLTTSEVGDGLSCSVSASVTSALSVFTSAPLVSSDQRQNNESCFCVSWDKKDREYSAGDSSTASVADKSTEAQADRLSIIGNSHDWIKLDTSKHNHNASWAQADFMDVGWSEQLVANASKIGSPLAGVSFLSSGVHSEGYVQQIEASRDNPDSGNGEQQTACSDAAERCAVINKPAEAASDYVDNCPTIMEHTQKSLQGSSDPDRHSEPQLQGMEKEEKGLKDAKNKRKNRRRSTFGEELRRDVLIHHEAANVSAAALQTADGADRIQSPSQTVSEKCSSLKDNLVACGQADDNSNSRKIGDQEQQEKEEAGWPVQTRKKRSAGTSVNASTSQDTSTGSDADSSLFTKRRSSLRLYRQQCQRSVVSAPEVDKTERDETQPPAAVMDSESATEQEEGCFADEFVNSGEEAEPVCDTIPFQLEQLYKNKNFKKPADKTWETIFENPSRGRDISKQKLKRFIQFEDHVPVSKLKRRLRKALLNGWNVNAKTSNKSDKDVLKKLEQLDNEMSMLDD
ncbi:uncharacterized protein LOC143274711 [Babylonia areolata]|uniref:uncharacterized protein LOC143274711 n=1 Tax=Babylonia areolata TaxID=304850 RepID=UPI003FCF396E